MPEWTVDQKKAIDGRSGSLIVSAAAGSGKTTVLVERVIKRLIDTENRCPANELVIVTFTRAAAAQMKERIEAALVKRIASGSDAWLTEQQLLLQSAKISTIDSFCVDLVRENFQNLGISTDFYVSDETESERLSQRALKAVFDEMYANGGQGFADLTDILSSGSSDSGLADAIKTVYKNISSYPFPLDELERLVSPYFGDEPVEQSVWGGFMLEQVKKRLEYCRDLMLSAESLITDPNADPAVAAAVGEMVTEEKQLYANLLSLAQSGEWDELYSDLVSMSFKPFSRARKLDAELKNAVKQRRDKAKAIADKLGDMICCTADEFAADRLALRPTVTAFVKCVQIYSEELAKIKKAEEKFDFTDIEHMALNLLVEKKPDGTVGKTDLALSLSKTYKEIMVDEYQDTNELQDMLFSAISNEENNLFFVGDVKQSIYRFRQAMPEIFLHRRDSVPDFDGENYPAKVTLGANFRSRNTVTTAVNFLFGQLMSKDLGEICYDENERLNALASYPEHDEPDVEFHLRTKLNEESEPEFVAQYIKKLIDSQRLVKDGDIQRPVCAGDICILTRVKKRMSLYAAALENIGIPAVSVVEGEVSASAEVKIILSLLKVLDNPLQDIPLTGLMMSPVFGFTADELAKIRTGVKRNTPVYRSVASAAESGNERCKAFLHKIDSIRRIGIGMGAAEFLRRVYDETDIFAIAMTLSTPEQRVANLWSLLDRASAFDSTGGCGLAAFLRFIESSGKKGTEFSVGDNSHAVKVMTIHKSKGLEFPVCILADLSSDLLFNEPGSLSFSKSFGLGLLLRDKLSGKSVKTLAFSACEQESKLKDLSEEIRILYVALTRAKELLVFVGTRSKPVQALSAAPLAFCSDGDVMDYGYACNASDYLDWLLPVFSRHMDACDFYVHCDFYNSSFILKPDFSMKTKVYFEPFSQKEIMAEQEPELKQAEFDETLAEQLRKRMNYEYPYAKLNKAASAKHASGFADEAFDDSFFASSRPDFMNTGGMTPAQKGTLAHKFMQLCDLNNSDITAQLEQFVNDGQISEQEAKELCIDELKGFYDSDICRRIRASGNVMREKKFAMLMSVNEVYPELPESFEDEKIVVRGMLDLAFEEKGKIVIVDYKTDREVDEDELRLRHCEQLRIYAEAIERCTDYKVGEAYIYSLPLKREIKVF